MLGNGLSCGIKMLGDRIGRHCLQRDQRNDRPPCRVGYGLENISFHYLAEEYATKRLQIQVQPNGFVNSFYTFLRESKTKVRNFQAWCSGGISPNAPRNSLYDRTHRD